MPELDLVFLPAKDVEQRQIVDFAVRTWGQDAAASVLTKWWLTGDQAEGIVACDRREDRIAGMVVVVPSIWSLPNGEAQRCASICGWYVAPDYAGAGIGRLLAQSVAEQMPCQNALSISAAAISSFTKLGWTGPFRTSLQLLPLPALRRRPAPMAGMVLRSWRVEGARLPEDLCGVIDRIEKARPAEQVRRKRDAVSWQRHLSVHPDRVQHFHVLEMEGAPVGMFVIRATDDEAGRAYRLARLHYVTDLVLNSSKPEVVRHFVRSIGPAAPVSAGASLVCTSDLLLASALSECGWLGENSPVIGPKLATKTPQFMLGGNLTGVDPAEVVLSFTDSDVDHNI